MAQPVGNRKHTRIGTGRGTGEMKQVGDVKVKVLCLFK